MSNTNEKKKLFSFLGRKKKQQPKDIFEEEIVKSPIRTMVDNFFEIKTAVFGLCLFIVIFLIVIITPFFVKLDLSYTESSQQNMSPGFDLMKVPDKLKGNILKIRGGTTFSIGVDKEGNLYQWGKTKNGLEDVPQPPADAKNIVDISVGDDHALALDKDGYVYAWGINGFGQATVPENVKMKKIVSINAGYKCSIAVDSSGKSYFWGNEAFTDFRVPKEERTNLAKVLTTSDTALGLTKDGRAIYLGNNQNSYSKVPKIEGKVVDIATTAQSMAAIDDKGKIYVWGNAEKNGENKVPTSFDGKIIKLSGGRYHYDVLTDKGKVYSWGSDKLGQTDVPKSLAKYDIKEIFTGAYQNYAVDSNNKLHTWGLKGYLLGTDDLGRDIFARLLNGGKMTMSIGSIAVVISTIIGIIIGCISGFFGGKVDILLQRFMEIVSSLPFLPFAMILTSLIGNRLDQNQRILLIMFILGILSWPSLSRLVRAQVLAEREKEFVTAAKAVGVTEMSIVFKHILPNVISVIIVTATLDFATCMLTESSLSYLGFGVNPPQPTWGNMLNGANNSVVVQNFPWRWVFTSLILGTCTICINMIGDGLRDALDPKSNER